MGATGYVGGRLVPRLLEAGCKVRILGRSAAKIGSRPWACRPGVEIVEGDVLDVESLRRAVSGCRAAFYLVHFMNDPRVYPEATARQAALNLVAASEKSSLERIIYLGGLRAGVEQHAKGHAHSRGDVEELLGSGTIPLTVLRSAMILGSGSASFEILRYLADRQPVLLSPPWLRAPVRPISIRNVLNYLLGCLENEQTAGQTLDICGPETITCEHLIDIYTEVAGLRKRIMIPIPFIGPRLGAIWIHLITPVPASVAGLFTKMPMHEDACRDNRIRSLIPQELLNCREAIRRALEKIEQQKVDACWTDAGALLPPEWAYCGDADYSGGTIMECGYRIVLEASPKEIWERVERIGGPTGWYYGNPLWRIRGWLDKIFGGTSLRRGRRHPSTLYVGDALDFWRVLDLHAPFRMLLLSEMKLPGEALLEFRIIAHGEYRTELRQLSRFLPAGYPGLLYWYSLYPAHQWIFRGMLNAIAKELGKPVINGPERFTPKLRSCCRV
jgi:uncharacterized protein YbjT (DUF2867 family)